MASAAMFVGYWPLMYKVSQRVKPVGCGVLTLGYAAAYFNGVKPMLVQQMQNSLNSFAKPFAEKYQVRTDEDYL